MNADLFAESIQYELLTKQIYEQILTREGQRTITVQHNIPMMGRSGVDHQIDVFWEFKVAGVTHRVAIECKNYASSLTLEKTRNFFGVLHDIGNCSGIMVTRTGYQSGAAAFAKYYGIALKLLRKPIDADWEGRISRISVCMHVRAPVSTEEQPISCGLFLRPVSQEQEDRLKERQAAGVRLPTASPDLQFLDSSGAIKTDELRWWLPRQLKAENHPDGGPYTENIPLEDHYIPFDSTNGSELIQVIGLKVDYHVATLETREFVSDAKQAIEAILKDFETGEWEYVQT